MTKTFAGAKARAIAKTDRCDESQVRLSSERGQAGGAAPVGPQRPTSVGTAHQAQHSRGKVIATPWLNAKQTHEANGTRSSGCQVSGELRGQSSPQRVGASTRVVHAMQAPVLGRERQQKTEIERQKHKTLRDQRRVDAVRWIDHRPVPAIRIHLQSFVAGALRASHLTRTGQVGRGVDPFTCKAQIVQTSRVKVNTRQ